MSCWCFRLFHIVSIVLFFIFAFSTVQLHGAEYVHPDSYRRTVLLTGFTYPRKVVKVSTEVSGKCTRVSADVGDAVPVSGIFATVDETFVSLDIEANKLQQERVRRQLATEKKTLKRYTTLRRENSATEATLDEVQLSADLHELTLKDLSNQLQKLNEKLQRHKVSAPPGWLVIERMVEPGEFVQTGQSVARVGDFSQLIVTFSLGFEELQVLQAAQEHSLFLPEPGLTVEAAVFSVSPSFLETTKKIEVKLILAGHSTKAEESLRGGMRAELRLQLPGDSQAFTLPLTSIINRYDAHWVMRSDGKRLRVIFLGTDVDGATGIVSSPDLTADDSLYRIIPADF